MDTLKHEDLWDAIDRLAALHRMSASGLARRAGLDPTTFNKSKRQNSKGKRRWPSTESLSKILDATGASVTDFVRLLKADNDPEPGSLPLMALNGKATGFVLSKNGDLEPSGIDRIHLPELESSKAVAFQVTSTSFAPAYRQNDLLIVHPAKDLQPQDRALIVLEDEQVVLCDVLHCGSEEISVRPLDDMNSVRILRSTDISWSGRVAWARQ